jgi:hypothetical protein
MDITLSLSKIFSIIGTISGWALIAIFMMTATAVVVGFAKAIVDMFIKRDSVNNDPELSDYAEPERLKPVK